MDTSKIQSISIKTPEKPGEDFVVTVNDAEFMAKSQSQTIAQALDFLGEPTTGENIVEFIEIATKGISPATTNANAVLAASQRPIRKSKAKAEKKPKPENELIGKVFLGKKGELFRLVAVTPPGDWQFELECLDTDNRGGTKRLGIKEFKELTELVPKRSRKKEGK